jgi:uncharacterized integral membrane protein
MLRVLGWRSGPVDHDKVSKALFSYQMARRVLFWVHAAFETKLTATITRQHQDNMNPMMFIKLVIVTGIFLLLVLMGLNNRSPVDFHLPPLVTSAVKQPAALMYFGFFAVGLITGAILSVGAGKPAGKPGKPA